MGRAAAKPIICRRNDVIDKKTQAALSQIGREEKAAAADKVSPIVRHRASVGQLKVMGFAEPVIGPATSGRTRWLNPSYELQKDRIAAPQRNDAMGHERHFAPQKNSEPYRPRPTAKDVTDRDVEACYVCNDPVRVPPM
jgi:hypothetical protein